MAVTEREVVDFAFSEAQDSPLGLKGAAYATLELRSALSSFRRRCLQFVEKGTLFEAVESWYVQKYVPPFSMDDYPKSLVDRNPYAAFKDEHPVKCSLYSKLDFLLDEIPVEEPAKRAEIDLSPDEYQQLLMDLSVDGKLASLIRPSPYLTHAENVGIAALDSRLWLRNAHIPLELGRRESYKEVRSGVPFEFESSSDVPPSTFNVLLKEGIVKQYYSMQMSKGLMMYHPLPEDFPKRQRSCYFARLARVGFSYLDERVMSQADFAAVVAKFHVDEEEAVAVSLRDWKWNETSDMYKLLAKLIYDLDVDLF